MDYKKELCVRDDVTLHGDDFETDPHSIYVDENQVYHAVSEKTGKVRYFSYTKPLEIIKTEHRDEILTYMFGKHFDKDEEVHGIDVFMQNKYCKEITLFKTDFVLIRNGKPIEKLDIIYAQESIDEMIATGFKLQKGEKFIAMTDLSESLQAKYLKEIVSLRK